MSQSNEDPRVQVAALYCSLGMLAIVAAVYLGSWYVLAQAVCH
jgi:hypothetical protein